MLRRRRKDQAAGPVRPPEPHPSGAHPPAIPAEFVPHHVALVMDGNGRWANQRGLPRTEGHKRGEAVLIDVAQGAIELGVKWLSVYAFSTENWKRSPEEVRFLMGFNRDVIRRQVDFLGSIGVRVRWAGRTPKLWRSVIKELQAAEEKTRHNDVLNLTMCVNYGGRAEIVDTVREIARLAAAGKINPDRIDERMVSRHGYVPEMPPVDMFLRPSGELRTSNFLVWQAAYAEMVYQNTLFPDFDRRDFWRACEEYARRDRRFGAAVDQHSSAAVDQHAGAAIEQPGGAGGDQHDGAPVDPPGGAVDRAGGGQHGGHPVDRRPGAGLHIGSDVEVDDYSDDHGDEPYPDEPFPAESEHTGSFAGTGSPAPSTISSAADHGDARPSGGMA